MTAYLSNTTGILSYKEKTNWVFYNLQNDKILQEDCAIKQLSYADDLLLFPSKRNKELILEAKREYWSNETAMLIREILIGLPNKLENRTFNRIERNLETGQGSPDDVLDKLLIAPISDDIDIINYSKKAVHYGAISLGNILDKANELQPLLKAYVDCWLTLGISELDCSLPKEIFWRAMVSETKFSSVLSSNSKTETEKKLNELLFYFINPRERIEAKKYLKLLLDARFPHQSIKVLDIKNIQSRKDKNDREYQVKKIEGFKALEEVNKQIETIIQLIEQGIDKKAKRYLDELIEMQLSFPNGEDYALKSLCRMAKMSADILRYDFEYHVLQQAFTLEKVDQWTYIQYADHLKRVEKYSDALENLDKAKQFGHINIIDSLYADIKASMGHYNEALNIYTELESKNDDSYLIAIADIKRKLGIYDEAREIYQKILDNKNHFYESGEIDTVVRAKVGTAEIFKSRGQLDKSKKIYEEVVKNGFSSRIDEYYYKIGYCHVLKLNEDYDEAYKALDEIIERFPFSLRAKYLKVSILGLISKENEGLIDLTNIKEYGWIEWLNNYFSGLLLLKLKRYKEAKNKLIEDLPKKLENNDKDNTLRLGAAYYFLYDDNHEQATKFLEEIPDSNNQLIKYMKYVFELHMAKQRKSEEAFNLIYWKLKELEVYDKKIQNAVTEIKNGNFKKALIYELEVLFNLAA